MNLSDSTSISTDAVNIFSSYLGENSLHARILDPEKSLQNDLIKQIYAEVLYRWNLLNQRAMVLKNIGAHTQHSSLFDHDSSPRQSPADRLPNLINQCHKCRSSCRSVICSKCRYYSFFCSICQLPVKGTGSICTKCLHGGHVTHYDSWFRSYNFCPTGCGCRCLQID